MSSLLQQFRAADRGAVQKNPPDWPVPLNESTRFTRWVAGLERAHDEESGKVHKNPGPRAVEGGVVVERGPVTVDDIRLACNEMGLGPTDTEKVLEDWGAWW